MKRDGIVEHAEEVVDAGPTGRGHEQVRAVLRIGLERQAAERLQAELLQALGGSELDLVIARGEHKAFALQALERLRRSTDRHDLAGIVERQPHDRQREAGAVARLHGRTRYGFA